MSFSVRLSIILLAICDTRADWSGLGNELKYMHKGNATGKGKL